MASIDQHGGVVNQSLNKIFKAKIDYLLVKGIKSFFLGN